MLCDPDTPEGRDDDAVMWPSFPTWAPCGPAGLRSASACARRFARPVAADRSPTPRLVTCHHPCSTTPAAPIPAQRPASSAPPLATAPLATTAPEHRSALASRCPLLPPR